MKTINLLIFSIIGILVTSVSIVSISAQPSNEIPSWVKNTALWWGQDQISDADFLSAIQFLIEQKIIQVSSTDDTDWKQEAGKIYAENRRLKGDIEILEKDVSRLINENKLLEQQYNELLGLNNYDSDYDSYDSSTYYEPEPSVEEYCYGYAECFVGSVSQIVDGDTIKVDGQSIRFSLVNTPEYGEYGYEEAKNYVQRICPVGSAVLVDEDDGQTQGSYGRMIALVYCDGLDVSLNEAILQVGFAQISTSFCSTSEFSFTSWAQNYGCGYEQQYSSSGSQSSYTEGESSSSSSSSQSSTSENGSTSSQSTSETTQQVDCDPSYPDFCIPPPPPDLNCADISQKNFTVLQPDPHRFDGDKDGIGCES